MIVCGGAAKADAPTDPVPPVSARHNPRIAKSARGPLTLDHRDNRSPVGRLGAAGRGRLTWEAWVRAVVARLVDRECCWMVFSWRMVPEVVQPFWAALQRGEFITGAAEEDPPRERQAR
jgi:hypothetical protein